MVRSHTKPVPARRANNLPTATYIIDDLAPRVHKTHHVIMIEKNSHMQVKPPLEFLFLVPES